MGQADLHIHTTASDGQATVKAVLDYVASQRPHLTAIAITDHDTLDASLWACDVAHQYPFEVIPGLEVSSTDGHVLALWVTQIIPAALNLQETVAAIHEAGGLAILAHPFHFFIRQYLAAAWEHWLRPGVLVEAGLDGLEVHNAGVGGWGCNALARHVARGQQLAVTGGSDAHTLGAIGSGITCYAGSSAADLRRALSTGDTTVEGSAWPRKDYVAYFKHEQLRKGIKSSALPNS